MTISQARLEFGKRYALWALHTAEREVEESFRHFRVFKGGLTWKFYQFVRQLTKREQLSFVRASRKDVYLRESERRSEPLSMEETRLLARFERFYLEQRGLELEIPARRRAGEQIKFASKRTLQTAITKSFVNEFGDREVAVDSKLYQGVGFQMTCAGWLVMTTFTFGRQAGVMDYRHLIAGESGRVDPNGTVSFPTPILAMLIWTNICPIQWEYLFGEDVEAACDSAIELCRDVFDVLPKLLSGIERDKVAIEPG